MPCDICSDPNANNTVTAQTMKHAIETGFNPFTAGLIPVELAKLAHADSPGEWKRQALDGLLSHSNWKLCSDCLSGIPGAAGNAHLQAQPFQ